ncbi:MAG: 50S ribosomal protein L25 [Thermodesulfobacteriota bacterium]
MEEISLPAGMRSVTGRAVARRLRREGMTPAVLYGPGIEKSLPLSLNRKELERVLHLSAGANVIVTLEIEGGDKKTAMFKEVVRHPVRNTIEHVDLIHVIYGTLITVEVPLQIEGKAKGQVLGGIVQHGVRKMTVECLPRAIPDSLSVDITELDIGDAIHIKDVILPEGVKLADDEELTVLSVVAPAAEEEVKSEEEIGEELAKSFEEKEEEETPSED